MKKRSVALLIAAAGALTPIVSSAQISGIGLMPGHPSTPTIFQATGTQKANFPGGMSFDVFNGTSTVKKVIVPFASNPDNSPTSTTARLVSNDGGITFGAVQQPNPSQDAGMILKRRNGQIISLPYNVPNPFTYWVSNDNGATWVSQQASINTSLHFHRSILEDFNGDLYATGYNGIDVKLVKSTNGGASWSLVSTPFDGGSPGDGRTYTESTLERCADGSWLMVTRHDTPSDPAREMLYVRSTNKGVTWTTPAPLTNIPIGSGYLIDVDPHLKLMPNGILVLSYGARKTQWEYCDNKVAFSYNNGQTWHHAVVTFEGMSGLGPPGKMTSGYTAAIPITAHRFLQIGDTGTTWTYGTASPSPNPYSIWGKYVDIVRTEQNRIDLKAKHLANAITIMPATTLTLADPAHTEARPAAAFDGNTEYWSAAMGTSSGILQLDLQRTYRINAIGLAMLEGKQQSASVQYSADGTTWSSPVVNYSNATHYALNYTTGLNFSARYVRVNVSGTGTIGLAELELYEASHTFENSAAGPSNVPHGPIPTGYVHNGTSTTQYGAAVVDGTGYQSNRALKLWDGSSTWRAGIKRNVTGSNLKTLDFRCRIAALPNTSGSGGQTSFGITILGKNTSNAEVQTFYVAVFANSTGTAGDVKYNNGSGWVQLGTATLPVSGSVWKRITMVCNESANTATLSIDGVQQGGAFGMFSAPSSVTTLTGYSFNSNGTPTSGEVIYFDDVNFYDPTTGGASGVSSIIGESVETVSAVETWEISDAKRSELNAESGFAVSVSPNPASGSVKLNINNPSTGSLNLKISDLSGKLVKSVRQNITGGKFVSLDLPINELTPGLYIISAENKDAKATAKLIVQ